MKVVLWNARGLKNKREEVSRRIQDCDVLVVTELKNKVNERCKMPNFHVVIKDSHKISKAAAGGIGIMVRKEFKVKELEHIRSGDDNIEVLGVQVSGLKKDLIIIAFYRRPGEVVERGIWKKIINRIGSKDNLLCVGDFNAHNHVWNCERTDRNGENLLEDMEECDLFLVNRDTLNRVGEGGRTNSNLDLGFCSEELIDIMKYSQKDDTWGSDHFPIEFDIGIEMKTYRKKTNRITTKRTDWEIFEQSLKEREKDLEEEEYKVMNNSDKYEKIIRDIKESVRVATYGNGKKILDLERKDGDSLGMVLNKMEGKGLDKDKKGVRKNNIDKSKENSTNKGKKKKNPVSWWDDDCNKVIDDRKKAIKNG